MSKSKKIFKSTGPGHFRINKAKMLIGVLIIVAVAVGGYFLYMNTGDKTADLDNLMANGKFAKGITVDNTDIGGFTFAQAQQTLDPVEYQKTENFNMTIILDPDRHNIKGDDLNVDTDLEAVLQQAIVIGQNGNRRERKKELSDVKKNGHGLNMKYIYDNDLLDQQLDTIQQKSGKAAEDATVKIEGGDIKYIEGKTGIKIDKERLINDINAAFDSGQQKFDIYAQTLVTAPSVTVADLKSRLVKKAGTNTEFKSSTTSRVGNIVKAAGLLNGKIIKPGETFSINAALGARTSENGWYVATAIASGKYIDDVGGGVCQVSSTLYNAAVKSGLTVVARRPHSYPVAYLPTGQDAAISTGGPDLKLKNDFDFPVYIVSYASSSSKTIGIDIYGPKNEDGGSYVFKTNEVANEEPSSKASVKVNNNLLKGEYVEIKPRKNKIEVERWMEYVIDGKIIKTEKMSNDYYGESVGEYAMGPGTDVDSKTGKPKGKKVDEEYLTKKRETTSATTKETTATTKAPEKTVAGTTAAPETAEDE